MNERTVRVDLTMTYRMPGSRITYGPGKGVLVPVALAQALGLVAQEPKVDSRIVGFARTVRGVSTKVEIQKPVKRTRRARSDRGKKRVKKDTAKAEA